MKQGEAMSLLKQLLPLAALLLLSIVPTDSRVVTSVEDCNEFFLQQIPPNIPGILEGGNTLDQNRYKVICQTLRNIRRFVTLYDTKNRIPVFSAAEYRGGPAGKRPKIKWMIEPQLENINDNDNMIPADKTITYNHQAGDIDYYKQTEFDRGHLFPSLYKSDEVDKRSTFTLTNAVPQRRQFNNGRWNMMERCVKCILDNYCINNNDRREGFVVIGAQPGNENPLNQRINIPSVLWSAFCCYSHSKESWLASAHWGENKDDGPNLQTKTLAELHTELGIEAFPGTQCPNDTSVTELYSEPESLCHSKCRQYWNRKKSTSTPPTTTALQIQHLCLLHLTHRSLPAPHLSHHLEHLPHFPPQFQITVPHLVSQQLALWVLQPVSTAATV
ncbi:endonuclease domain-containing 1 protein isoform X1 [Oreochromis niloticus]|uniref:endonuclease domain-containing 1 protein isoform X1 n=1 Tax=Oreochromis niloticus TaxID=8128 RepID=UPI00090563AC|nr:endonuclease domain-containing 1 protein isoform X1 [Oreochromis niloticus]